MWAEWIRKRYLRKGHIWNCQPPNGCTSSWRQILKSRNWIIPNIRYIIFEGANISLWNDPWLNGRCLSQATGREFLHLGPLSTSFLSTLIKDGKWDKPNRWPMDLDPLWTEISEIEVGGKGPDLLIWPPSRKGYLNRREAMKHLSNSSIDPPSWTKWLWQPYQVPKHSFLAWQFFHNKISSLSRLFKKGLVTDQTCTLCKAGNEDADHLALQCAYSRFILQRLLSDMLIKSRAPRSFTLLSPWLDATISHPFKKTILASIISNFLWFIWQERNNRIFRDKSTHKVHLCHKIKAEISLRLQGIPFIMEISPELSSIAANFGVTLVDRPATTVPVQWIPPELSWLKANSDGSLSEDRGGYGALIRNERGDFLIGVAGQCGLPSINLLEFKGLLAGLEIGIQMHLDISYFDNDWRIE
ncbi:hypothetical protein QJS10_CPA06g01230 [Acorus calamus]|uniref:Reverse transcriptase zinc-binding domain-containing protein n=1 Tax=Acorus calamus TaxID=4465 RepID=A0AAV9EPW8_ACOCL|nr:hypothetical protein QJS10_CPA06g01230 [Acorus calamus]